MDGLIVTVFGFIFNNFFSDKLCLWAGNTSGSYDGEVSFYHTNWSER